MSKMIHHTKENKVGDNDERDRVEKSRITSALHTYKAASNKYDTHTEVRFIAYSNCRHITKNRLVCKTQTSQKNNLTCNVCNNIVKNNDGNINLNNYYNNRNITFPLICGRVHHSLLVYIFL